VGEVVLTERRSIGIPPLSLRSPGRFPSVSWGARVWFSSGSWRWSSCLYPGLGWVFGGRPLGPVAAGAAFSLVISPRASPFLAALLAAAATQALPGLTVVSMVAFALGYTAIVFAAGVVGGSAVRRLQRHSFAAPRVAGAASLLVTGAAFLAAGWRWF